jgi:hypothetical protein
MQANFEARSGGIARLIFAALLALFSVWGISLYFFGVSVQYGNSVLNFVLVALIFGMCNRSLTVKDRRNRVVSFVLGAVFSLFLVIGKSINRTNSIYELFSSGTALFSSLLMFLGLTTLLGCALTLLFWWLMEKAHLAMVPTKNQRRFFRSNVSSFFAVWLVILLAWGICYLACFPGYWTYDLSKQARFILGLEPYTQWHPVIHTEFLRIFINIGERQRDMRLALILYSVCQMLILSAMCSFSIWYLAKKNVHIGIRLAALLYYALNPTIALFSFLTTKDVIFGGLFLLSCIGITEMVLNTDAFFRSKPKRVGFSVVLLLTCLFRNNAIIAFAPAFIAALLIIRRYALRVSLVFVSAFLAFALLTGVVFGALGIKPTSLGEVVSVPVQQIALATNRHEAEIDPEQLQFIDSLFDRKSYNPRLFDKLKSTCNEAVFKKSTKAVIDTWASLLLRYPLDYVDAFLSLNHALWYPDAQLVDPVIKRPYIEAQMHQVQGAPEFDTQSEPLIPILASWYKRYSKYAEQDYIPFVSSLFSLALPLWLCLVGIALCIIKRGRKMSVILLPTLFLLLSYLLGPVTISRYLYPMFICYPLYIAFLLTGHWWNSGTEDTPMR